jgi:hypothetical protein
VATARVRRSQDHDTMQTYRPIPRSDRPETSPVLPLRVSVDLDGSVTAEYADWSPERYATLETFCAAHEMTAAELGEAQS